MKNILYGRIFGTTSIMNFGKIFTRKKIVLGLKNPSKAFRYFTSGKEKKVSDGINAEKCFELQNMTKQKNNNSKYYSYFEFYKRILRNTLHDQSLRTRFLDNPEQVSESEMALAITSDEDLEKGDGGGWNKETYTMIGHRLENLQLCVEDVLKNDIHGDMIETGVWRGGSCIFMRLILKKYEIKNKIVFVADSFEGLPKPDADKYPEDANDVHHIIDVLNVSLEQVKNNFKTFGVLDEQVKFLKGWFKDTLKTEKIGKLSILRLDGDMYESTWDVLTSLYDKLSIGGYLIIDDYALTACHAAVNDFRSQNNIVEPIEYFDGGNVYWKKVTEIATQRR